MNIIFDSYLFAAALRTRRGERSLRDVAEETGISASTLSRIENGETPDMETFLLLSAWTGWPTNAFLHENQDRNTVQLIEQTLREDGILTPNVIEAFLVLLQAVRGRSARVVQP